MADTTETGTIRFESGDGEVRVDALLDSGTAWMTRSQMAALFGCAPSVIARHIRTVFAEAELDPGDVQARMVPVHAAGARGDARAVDHFAFEMVIAVGLRVRSRQAAVFRSWVAGVLPGQVIGIPARHPIRLARPEPRQDRAASDAGAGGIARMGLPQGEGPGVGLVAAYSRSWELFHAFDENRLLAAPASGPPSPGVLDHAHASRLIAEFKRHLQARGQASAHFGRAGGGALAGSLGSIGQTAFGEPLYPTREERAAQLLYLLVKDHPFTDGNKRIGSLLFLYYLRQERVDYRIDPDALVALTLLVAASAPADKERMVRLVINQLRKSQG